DLSWVHHLKATSVPSGALKRRFWACTQVMFSAALHPRRVLFMSGRVRPPDRYEESRGSTPPQRSRTGTPAGRGGGPATGRETVARANSRRETGVGNSRQNSANAVRTLP